LFRYIITAKMSAASLLKVYDGQDPELAFATAGPGGVSTLAEVLGAGNSAGTFDIDMNGKSVLAALDVVATGDVSVGGAVKGTDAATFVVESAAGQGISIQGAVGASLVAGTGGAAVTAGGALTLTAATAQPNGLVLAGAGLVPAASAGPNIVVTHVISFKAGATTYWLPVLSAAPTA